ISSPVPIDSYIQELNNSWTITINPNQTGSMVLEFTFSLLNYQSALFILHINIIPANTNIFTTLISPTTVYYNDTLEFFLFFENTDYSENISGVTPVPLDTKVRFINQTGNFYWFNFSSEMLLTGIHAIDISFSDPYFEDNSIVVQFDVSKVPNHITDLIPSNMTTIGEMSLFNYTNSQTISITWIDDFSGLGIIDYDIIFSGNGSSFISIDSKHDNGTHFFIFLGSAVGKYQVIITFETAYYSSTNYVIYFIVSEMETRMIDVANLDYNETLMAEEIFTLVIPSYQTYGGINILQIDNLIFWINGTEVFGPELELNLNSMPFSINLSTSGYHYGFYNFTIEISTLGYQFQRFSLNVTINGWETTIDVNVEPGNIIERGQEISFFITLSYKNPLLAGFGSTINLINLEGVEITFSIELKYINGSTQLFQEIKMTDSLGKTSYTIPGAFTKSATGFTQIRISAGSSMSGLPYIYSLTAEELAEYKITEIINPLEVLLQGALFLSILAVIFLSVYSINKRRVRKKSIKRLAELNIEQSFEDIKSIRLIIARHESGLQFYSEKTITDMATDTDALSGMSAAISTFMEELSDTMTHATEEREKDKIEVMSREGLHLLVWHGNQSSLIIISEIRLPDYFQGRLKTLGRELENRFSEDLKDFYATDQIPSHIVKKMVRKHIPLHYFCAFVLNEGVLTLDSIKLPKKYKSMFEQIKEIRFEKQGVQYLFSEQIISHLSKRYKRSEAIKFLDYAIDINLLIETSQEDIANLGKN
ncbi:hypothetical protein, partial [Candidatus Hodarchaeum mangrovi]